MRLSISVLHLAKLNWHGLPSGPLGYQILQRDETFTCCISLIVEASVAPELYFYRGPCLSVCV